MNINVCTLFEGHYHFGLAGLSNSLYKNGFRGSIYAGYRNELPNWASGCFDDYEMEWIGAKKLVVGNLMNIYFLPIDNNIHFANYKADFMLKLWDGPAQDLDGLVYFDPDIVVKYNWSFYEKWIDYGVALVHEISVNDMPPSHPFRKQWEKIINTMGMTVTNKLYSYINSGFCGISRRNIEFLNIWSHIMKIAEKDYNYKKDIFTNSSRTDPFCAGDQDALNIAAMCCTSPLSEIGPEGMDFIRGGFTMSHAIGSPKPWKKNFLLSSIKGITPSMPDKEFWLNPNFPIKCFSDGEVLFKKIAINLSGFIGRFYRRN